VLDESSYGRAKLHWGHSTSSYDEDLDLGRRAAVLSGINDQDVQTLVQHWMNAVDEAA
jgi:hypothetical protein